METPKHIRVYDNGGRTLDRYTIVFTKKRTEPLPRGEFVHLGMSEDPTYPLGFCQHGFSQEHIDKPKYSHLGKKISFNDLPEKCKEIVVKEYKAFWGME